LDVVVAAVVEDALVFVSPPMGLVALLSTIFFGFAVADSEDLLSESEGLLSESEDFAPLPEMPFEVEEVNKFANPICKPRTIVTSITIARRKLKLIYDFRFVYI
jgi:hypothetical protein